MLVKYILVNRNYDNLLIKNNIRITIFIHLCLIINLKVIAQNQFIGSYDLKLRKDWYLRTLTLLDNNEFEYKIYEEPLGGLCYPCHKMIYGTYEIKNDTIFLYSYINIKENFIIKMDSLKNTDNCIIKIKNNILKNYQDVIFLDGYTHALTDGIEKKNVETTNFEFTIPNELFSSEYYNEIDIGIIISPYIIDFKFNFKKYNTLKIKEKNKKINFDKKLLFEYKILNDTIYFNSSSHGIMIKKK